MAKSEATESDGTRRILTPSALNRLVRELIEGALPMVWIEGELSNVARPASGHLYFSLKDAAAQVRCAMFKPRSTWLKFRPTDGMHVLARARVSLYEARGEFQLIVEHLEEAGEGALRRAFELLKAKLHGEGLFDESRKRPLPRFPRRIGVITSPTGAAIRDVLSVAARRFPLADIEILPVPVQGVEAPASIASMLRAASDSGRYDLLLLTRGGGSLEDLMAFNDEGVARAIAASAVPVVSAVGHEIDFSISDFVADLRAPTPSAAAELILPDGTVLARTLSQTAAWLQQDWRRRVQGSMQRLDHLATRLHAQRPQQRLAAGHERMQALRDRLLRAQSLTRERVGSRIAGVGARLDAMHQGTRLKLLGQRNAELRRRLTLAWSRHAERGARRLVEFARTLNAVSPLGVLQRGYAILFDADGKVLRSVQGVRPGDALRARLADGELPLRVDDKNTNT